MSRFRIGVFMTAANCPPRSLTGIAKELVLCFYIAMVLLMMDRSLENIYPFFLYATGKRIIDLWISFEMHMHVWLKWIIPSVFAVWLIRRNFHVRLGLLLPIAGVYLASLLTSAISGEVTFRWWNTTELPLMMYLFVTVQCSSRKGLQRLAFTGNILYSLLLILNAVFMFFPHLYDIISGWAPEYFLSADNLTGFPMFFGALLAFLDGYYNHSKARMIFYFILFFANLILIHCASAVMGAFFLLLYLMIPAVRKIFQKWNFNVFTALSVLLCIFLVGIAELFFANWDFKIWLHQFFKYKESIYIRLILWSGVFGECLLKPLFGYGLGSDAAFFARPDTSLTYNAHNAYLQTWREGGILTLGAIFSVLALFARKLKNCYDRKLAGFFAVIVFSDLIMMQSAITSWFTWYPVLIIVQIASLICTEQEELS